MRCVISTHIPQLHIVQTTVSQSCVSYAHLLIQITKKCLVFKNKNFFCQYDAYIGHLHILYMIHSQLNQYVLASESL